MTSPYAFLRQSFEDYERQIEESHAGTHDLLVAMQLHVAESFSPDDWVWVNDTFRRWRQLLEAHRTAVILDEVCLEAYRATSIYGDFHGPHEGYAVLLEEMDELWAHVKCKPAERDYEAMRAECIQIAAMAVKFATCLCDPEISDAG